MPRQRVFDVDAAIAAATDMFWRQGYERTSLADLTERIGVTPPSFYHEFGSKEGLFRRVLERYRATRLQIADDALNCSTAREVAEQMLTRLAKLYTDPPHPPGCLAVNCSLAGGAPEGAIQRELAAARRARRARITKRLERAKADGDLSADADAAALAQFLLTVGWGLASDARAGAKRTELLRTVRLALNAWPS
jgi:AcrR family transcriptional regulator